jgi:hypothetical protein
LTIDSILYPKVTNKKSIVTSDKKLGKKTDFSSTIPLEIDGLKGYAAAGKQVYKIMN